MYLQAIAYNYQLYRKEFIGTVITVAGLLMLLLSLILAPAAHAINVGGASDCDDNAIIRCGVHSTGAIVNAYESSAYVRGVYAEFGITRVDIASLPSTDLGGRVTKSGDVYVDGRSNPVATNAVTGGRQFIPGSTKVNHGGAIFYKRPPSVSFLQDSLPAFVSMNNGRFQFAVIASCGNAVSAAPTAAPQQHAAVSQAVAVSTPKPQKPAPAPAAAPAVTQTQSQEVNVSNTNVNQNSQTQINEQKAAPQAPPAKTTQPQPTATAPTAQPAVQASSTTLPNTGPTGVVGVFLIAVGLGTLGYRSLILRRFE